MVAQQILGKRRITEGTGAGRLMAESDRERTLEQLNNTSLSTDMNLLKGETDSSIVAAYNYRIGIKRALSEYNANK